MLNGYHGISNVSEKILWKKICLSSNKINYITKYYKLYYK